jgi:PAS domain S-box-containing protein
MTRASDNASGPAALAPDELFSDGGEAGAVLRGIDWSRKPVGPSAGWPASLRTALSLCLASRNPACLFWGEARLVFYNDACAPLIGGKHPWALGERYDVIWPENDGIIEPMVADVMTSGQSSRCDDLLLGLHHDGLSQEAYYSFSFVPVRQSDGTVGGVFTSLVNTTAKVVGQRRLRTLSGLARQASQVRSVSQAGRLIAETLAGNPHDLPFALLYVADADGRAVRLFSRSRGGRIPAVAPAEVALATDEGEDLWQLREAARAGEPRVLHRLAVELREFMASPWLEPVDTVMVLPVVCPGGTAPSGFLVCGISPRRTLDFEYREFLALVATQVGGLLAQANAHAARVNGHTPALLATSALQPLPARQVAQRVLVAHHDATARAVTMRLLQERYDVAAVPDSEAALAMIQQWQPELVLVDARLPGLPLIQRLRADAHTRFLPVIMQSESVSDEARSAALEAGADDFLAEPFGGRELLIRVQSQLRLAELRRHAEARIVASEMRLEQLVAMLPAGVYAVDAEGRIIFYNPRAAEIWGAAPSLHESYASFAARFKLLDASGAPVPLERRPIPTVLREGRAIAAQEATFERPDGSRFHASLSISPTFATDGRVNGAIAVVQDVTAERQARIALRETEERYRAVFQQAAVGIFECDLSGRILHSNPALRRMVGFSAEELSEMNWRDLAPPDEIESDAVVAAQLHRGERPGFTGERRLVRKDGVVIWLDVFATTILAHGGTPAYGLVILVDITERKRTEAELRETEQRFRVAADSAPVLIWTAGADRQANWFNKPWLDFVGRPLEAEIGDGWTESIHPEDRARVLQAYAQAFDTNTPFSLEYRLRRHDNVYRWMLTHGVPRYQGAELAGFIGSCVDITDRREAEEAMQESRNAERVRRQELERARDEAVAASRAKDDFLAALSHELRTPLSPVLLLSSDGATDPRLPASVRADFETIRKSVELEARLIDDLLDLTRIVRDRITLDLREVDVPVTLRDSLVAVRAEFAAKDLGLVLDLAPEPHSVWGDSVRLQQVFWNVLKNAVKFTPRGGRVTIATRVDQPGGRVEVIVSDTGIGMTPEEIGRVFKPFAQGDHAAGGGAHQFGGLGLGLAISQRIVALHHGTMKAESPGRHRGAVFRIALPLWQPTSVTVVSPPADAPATALAGDAAEPGPARRRVLLVEDHAPTRAALKSLLLRRRFDVVTAANAAEARAVVQQGPFDLFVSDIGLPDGNGYELMREFRERYGLVGIALTGYGMEDDIVRSRQAGFARHLTKPIRIQHLDVALDELLMGRSRS